MSSFAECLTRRCQKHNILAGNSLRYLAPPTFLLAVPISHALTFAAKRREHSDSCAADASGAMFKNMSVLASPPSDAWMQEGPSAACSHVSRACAEQNSKHL